MIEKYFESLRRQLAGLHPTEQEAIIEEIRGHIEDAEEDARMGKSREERRQWIMNEIGSPRDLAGRFRAVYRPGRIIDYLLILGPFLLYPYLNALYIALMPRYSWADVRLDVLIHLPLIALGLWRRSAAVVLFWAAILISQLSTITGRLYWVYGMQTVFWALLLLSLLMLAGYVMWQNRYDHATFAFGLLMIGMSVIGSLLNVLSAISPFSLVIWRGRWLAAQFAPYGYLDRLLLVAYTHVRGISVLCSVVVLALFFISSNHPIRWLALAAAGIMMGLGHIFLLDYQLDENLMAPGVYISWVILPILIVLIGLWRDRSRTHPRELAPA